MSRPMLLMQEELLSILWKKWHDGVPVSVLIRHNGLKVTLPTMKRLLESMSLLERKEVLAQPELYQIVYNSLFPEWVANHEKLEIISQPIGWKYKGSFPLGKWVNKTVNKGEENEQDN